MASEMGEAIRQLMQEKGISEDSVKLTIENMLKAAYKKTFGTSENAIVVFEDDFISCFAFFGRNGGRGVHTQSNFVKVSVCKRKFESKILRRIFIRSLVFAAVKPF